MNVDWETLRQLGPHYLAMVVLLTVVLAGLRLAFPELDFWVRMGVAVLVGLSYPRVVRAFGVAPEPWQR